mmetsp:Transcript_16316/g.41512  ORF Transcript_16316/g.41512 Transcript_16316/m.41512 type:complete len:223 (-) Transcript_16316:560-1228(-)
MFPLRDTRQGVPIVVCSLGVRPHDPPRIQHLPRQQWGVDILHHRHRRHRLAARHQPWRARARLRSRGSRCQRGLRGVAQGLMDLCRLAITLFISQPLQALIVQKHLVTLQRLHEALGTRELVPPTDNEDGVAVRTGRCEEGSKPLFANLGGAAGSARIQVEPSLCATRPRHLPQGNPVLPEIANITCLRLRLLGDITPHISMPAVHGVEVTPSLEGSKKHLA